MAGGNYFIFYSFSPFFIELQNTLCIMRKVAKRVFIKTWYYKYSLQLRV